MENVSKLQTFTSNLVKVFEIRKGLRGKVDCQKTAYFMKRLGVEVPFNFKWNVFGPYSYDLAHYCNYLEIDGLIQYSGTYLLNKDKAKSYISTLKPETVKRLENFFKKADEICEASGYDKVLFLECAASLDFIQSNVREDMRKKETTFKLLEELKPEKREKFRRMKDYAWDLLINEQLIH